MLRFSHSHTLSRRPSTFLLRKPCIIPRALGSSGGSSGGGKGWNGNEGRGDGDNEDRNPRNYALSAILGAHALALAYPALSSEASKADEEAENIMDWLAPLLASMGFSAVLGLTSAIALKVVGLALAFIIGLAFAAFQFMVYFEVIDINWKKVEKRMDVTGDEKFDGEDVKVGIRAFLKLLVQGVPNIGGFATGFMIGSRIF